MKLLLSPSRTLQATMAALLSLFLLPLSGECQQPFPRASLGLTPDSKIMSDIFGKPFDALTFNRYDELEKTAQEFRTSKEAMLTGEWKLGGFYDGTAYGIATGGDDRDSNLETLRDWAKERPKSITAQVALANGLLRYAWKLRGSPGRSISEDKMKVFQEQIAESRAILREAKKLPDKCPYWWVVAEKVAVAQEWDSQTFEGLFQEAIQFEPDCDDYYFEKLTYLHIVSDEEENTWEHYAIAVADKIGGEKGDMLYARMIWYMDREKYIAANYEYPATSFQRLDRGFAALLKLHPKSLLLMNAWARLCITVGTEGFMDRRKTRAKELFKEIGGQADSWVWPTVADFERTRDKALDTPHYYDIALKKLNTGDYKGALEGINQVINLYAPDPLYFDTRGGAYVRLGQYEAAVEDYRHAIDINPRYAQSYSNLSYTYAQMGKWKEALNTANKAIALDPEMTSAYLNRAQARRFTGDIKGAMADFQAVMDIVPDDSTPYEQRARVKADIRDYEEAAKDFGTALELNPRSVSIYSERAFAFYNSGKWKESLSDFRKFISLSKAEDDTSYQRLYVWLIRARLGEQAAATQALKAELASKKIPPAEWQGKIATFLTGEAAEAELLAAAEDQNPDLMQGKKTEAYFYAATRRLIAGDKTTAAEYFQKVLDLKKSSFTEFFGAEAELKILQSKP